MLVPADGALLMVVFVIARNIVARAKAAPLAPQDRDGRLLVAISLGEGIDQHGLHRLGNCVQLIGPVEDNVADAILAFIINVSCV
jgi:hypothetical protein